MNIIIDTNVLLNCIGARTKHHLIWQYFLSGKIILFVSVEILFEYQELIFHKYPYNIASKIYEILSDPIYVPQCEIYFNWQAIKNDPDDNKFFDAAVASNADYLVTNDNHFNEIKNIDFPKVNIVSADEFLEIIKRLD